MLLNDRKNRAWVVATSALGLSAIAWYAVESRGAGRLLGGGSRPGLLFGVAGGLICLFEMMLWPRKALRRWGQAIPLGRTQGWMRAHVWLGLLSLPLLVMHGGVYPWGGTLSSLLMVLFLVVIASGVWGLAMQQVLPRRMTAEVPAETVYSQIDYVRAQLRGEAARLVFATCGRPAETPAGAADDGPAEPPAGSGFQVPGKARAVQSRPTPERVGGSEPLLELFRREVAPYLCPDSLYDYYRDAFPDGRAPRPPRAREKRRSPLSRPDTAESIFEGVKLRLDPRAHPTVDAMAELCDQRRQFASQARLHAWLHNWMAIHLPLSVALTVLMVVHAMIALKYL